MGNKLPEGWAVKRFEDVCLKITDGSHFSPKTVENGYDYITVKDIDGNGNIDFIHSKKISKEDYHSLVKNDCSPVKGDILFSKDGTVGKVALIDFEKQFVVLSSLAIIRPNPSIVIPEYLKYLLASPTILDGFIGLKAGAAIKRIVLKTIKNFHIPIAPLPEQYRIVAQLNRLFERIDRAIALVEQNITSAQHLMASVLNDVFENTEWEMVPFHSVVSNNAKTVVPLPDEQYNIIGLENISKDTGRLIDFRPMLGRESRSSKVIFSQGSVLYGKLRPYLNKVYVAEFDGIATTEILPFKPEKTKLLPAFLGAYLRSPRFLTTVNKNCAGARMPRVTTKFWNTVLVPLPDLEIQSQVIKYLESVDIEQNRLVEKQQVQLLELKALKSSLLDAAFRGEL